MINEYEFDQTARNPRGVKERLNGAGDAWANQHRESLGSNFYLQDVDAMFGTVVFGHNTGERLFLEYVPDSYENRQNIVREFGVVAVFDRKSSRSAAFGNHNRVSTALYLWMCRTLGKAQSINPKFFFVIGGQSPSWEMVEIDIDTGEELRMMEVGTSSWRQIWHALGLLKLRNEIARWIRAGQSPASRTTGG